MNSSKNKLNSEIIFIFNPNPNAHLLFEILLWTYFDTIFIFFQHVFRFH